MVMGLVSGWSLANHSNSESFLVALASLSQDGCQREGFWEVDGHGCLLLTFPELFRLVVAYQFCDTYQDLLLKNNSCKWLLWYLSRVGGFSQCASPNKRIDNRRQAGTWYPLLQCLHLNKHLSRNTIQRNFKGLKISACMRSIQDTKRPKKF